MTRRILLVDDSKVALLMLESMFDDQMPGLDIHSANSADGAMAVLAQYPEEQFCLTIDYNMPGIDGKALCEKILAAYPQHKLVLLTANVLDSLVKECDDIGVKVLHKPIKDYVIEKALDYFGLSNGASDSVENLKGGDSEIFEPDISLSEEEYDLLVETFSIGMHMAANSLSKMMSQEVTIEIPHIEIASITAFRKSMDQKDCTCCILQEVDSPFRAKALMLFTKEGGDVLVKGMVGDYIDPEMLRSLYADALTEVGNVLLTPCIGAIGEMFDERVKCGFPEFHLYTEEFLDSILSGTSNEIVLDVSVNICVSASGIQGELKFILGPLAYSELKNPMDDFFKRLKRK